MRLLLDSHILLRLDSDPSLVPAFQRDVIADRANEVYVSAATAWELGIKQSKGKLILSKPVSAQRIQFGFLELPITFAHAE
jgi:PIN domain nuclease of toxin-antitoxin system